MSETRTWASSTALAALLLAAGLAASGFFIGRGLGQQNAAAGAISVKGLAEREVPASIAIWTLSYSASGNDLAEIDAKLSQSTASVAKFLAGAGFEDKDIAVQPPAVTDLSLVARGKDEPPPPARFEGSQSVLLRTSRVEMVKPALATAARLIAEGVQLSGRNEPVFIFNRINEIKPGMIEEATRNARIAAQQFAEDSDVKLGKLRKAIQGWFQAVDRDAATPEVKTVRVIVDVEYAVK